MINPLNSLTLEPVMQIWLKANQTAHPFISPDYWQSNYENVQQMLPQAEVYVCQKNGEVQGFIGLEQSYIAGLFVLPQNQSKGIGKELLDFVKTKKIKLSLQVYQKNKRAVAFYKREGFKISAEETDQSTGEQEFIMDWIQ